MLFNSSKLLWILLIARVALAVPLGIEYDTTTNLTPEEEENKVRLEKAKTDANQQIEAMRKGYNLRKTTAKGEFEAAFGKHPKLKHGVISSTIKDLETKNIRVKLATHPFNAPDEDPKSIAAVPWSRLPDAQGNEIGPWTAGKALFSSQFHGSGRNKLNDAGRAGTLIHEATHQLSKTGDNVNKGGNIIQPHDGSSHEVEGRTGYTSAHNMHKTIAKVNADREFTDTRDNANNMHSNAESYAVFASLCSKRNFDRRDIHLFNRALLEGDDDLLVYLARRNSCKVPPKNMAKKAAQKKTSAVKVGAKSLRPLKASLTMPGAARGKTGRQVAAGATRSRVGRLAKAGVTHGVSQHTKATKPVLKGAARAAHGSKVASKARAQVRKTSANHAKAGHLAPVGAKEVKVGHVAKTGAAHVKAGSLTKAGRLIKAGRLTKAGHLTKVGAAAHVKGGRVSKVGGSRAKVSPLAKTTSKVASKGAARHAGRVSKSSKVSSPKAHGAVKARPHVAGKAVKSTRVAKSSSSRTKAGTRSSKAGIRSSKAAIRSSKMGTRSPKLKTAVKGAHATAKAAHGAHLTPSRSRTPLVKGSKAVHQIKATRPKGQSPRVGKVAPARQPKTQARVPAPVVQRKVASRVTKSPVKRH